MRRLTTWGALSVAVFLMLASTGCKKREPARDVSPVQERQGTLTVRSELPGQIYRTRKGTYSNGDAIGICALQNGAVYSGYKNVKYTSNGSTKFVSLAGIKLPEDGSIDLVAYYPYASSADGTVTMDVSDQSDLAKIDLLYSNNSKGLSKTNAEANLTFAHQMAMMVLKFSTNGQPLDVASAKATIADVVVETSLTLLDGKLTNGSTKKSVSASFKEETANQLYTASFIVPAQDLSGKALTLQLNGKSYNETLPASLNPRPNDQVTVNLGFGSNGEALSITGSNITPWNTVNGGEITITPATGGVSVSLSSVEFPATGSLTSNVELTAGTSAWTASSDGAWLKVTPTSGTGNATLTLTAEGNTATTDRTATVTITAGTETVAISVTQKAASGTSPSTSSLLFPGADFEDWDAFLKCLNKFGLKHATKGSEGHNSATALLINASGSGNAYIFTVEDKNFDKQLKSISLWIKGTVDGSSLSFNVYGTGGRQAGASFAAFNLGTVNSSAAVMLNEGAKNDYRGSVNTNGAWVKVTLNIPSSVTVKPDQYGNIFAVKIGKECTPNLLVDDITYEAR